MIGRLRASLGVVLAFVLACADGAAGGGSTGSSGSGESTIAASSSGGSPADSSSGVAETGLATSAEGEGGATTGEPGSSSGGVGSSDGSESGGTADCAPGAKPGAAGSTDAMPTSVGVAINVRTPDDYDPTVAHPLMLVFSPAGGDPDLTESFTGLTPDALAAGYVIAYADHVSPMSIAVVEGLAPIVEDVVDTWCIDEARIFYTGHSDGGTISEVLLAVDDASPRPAAAAPSAAGITGTTAMQLGCPAGPMPIMVMHSTGDGLFPIANGFGYDAAAVWAGCNGCVGVPVEEGACQRWSGCEDDVPVLYCETAGAHGQWPGLNAQMLAFFAEVAG